MQHEDNKLFYIGMKGFISNGGKLLIMCESDEFNDEGKWELPGGRISHNEGEAPFQDVLLREIAEECGAIQVQVGDITHVFRRRFASGEWVLLLGFDCEYLGGDIVLSSEHTEYAWISMKDMEKYEFVNGYKEVISAYFQKKNS